MQSQQVRQLLVETGAVREGHFRLSSGLHSSVYLQCALVLQHPARAGQLAAALVAQAGFTDVSAVVAPALGGVVWGYELARQLEVRSLFVERNSEGGMELRRGFSLAAGERVLVAEDVVTTGGSTRETIEVVRRLGAEPVAVAALVDRSGGAADFGLPFHALLEEQAETFTPEKCPLCREGKPVEKPGSRPVKDRAR